MAKLYSRSNIAPKVEEKSMETKSVTATNLGYTNENSNGSMVEKTQVKTGVEKTESDNRGTILRVIGLAILIFALIALLVLGIIAIVTRISPKVDASMNKPVLSRISEYTNQESITVSGKVTGVSQVILYVDGKVHSVIPVKDEKFETTYKFGAEKKYTFEAAGVKGWILRSRSEKSDSVSTTYDKTAPSSKVELIDLPKEVTVPDLTIKGKAEPNSVVVFKLNDKEYTAKVTKDGTFEISGIILKAGENVFSVEVKDLAGNSTKVTETFKVTYNVKTSISTGTSTSPVLPNSAGELDAAVAMIAQNKFMFGFGLFALMLLIANGSVVAVKLYNENKR
jgi:hypothetical protein